jgi:hypothetical protein
MTKHRFPSLWRKTTKVFPWQESTHSSRCFQRGRRRCCCGAGPAVTGGASGAITRHTRPARSERISWDLRNEYVIGYSPSNAARDGTYRRIQLEVAGGEKLKADYRRGYYAPAQ